MYGVEQPEGLPPRSNGASAVAQATHVVRRRELPKTARRDVVHFQWGSAGLLLPAFALLVALFLIPTGYAFYLGLTNLTLIGPTAVTHHFTGLANVNRLLNDNVFSLSVELTGLFVAGSIVGCVVLGLALALLMRAASGVMRVVVGGIAVVAWMMPAVTAGMTWYASTVAGGTFSGLLSGGATDFLHKDPLLIVTLANTWSQAGFAMLVLGAALRGLPPDLIEAARLEKSTAIQRFFRIVIPMIRPTLTTVTLLVTLLTLANFGLVYIMSEGGPGNATNILPVYSYQQAFTFGNLAYGALIGDVMVVLAMILGLGYVKATKYRI